jgi:hypothetical protein
MTPSQDIRWVNKAKSALGILRKEPQHIKCHPAAMRIGWDRFKPSYMEEVKSAGIIVLEPRANVLDVHMIDADNASITEVVWYHFRCILVSFSQHHYIVVVAIEVEIVLAVVNIICSIVDPKNIMLVDATAFEQYMIEGGG